MRVEDALELAVEFAVNSPCRSKRAAILWGDGFTHLAVNGPPHPFICDGSLECKANCRETAVHAEQAALLMATPEERRRGTMLHVKVVNGKAVPSGPPSCIQCSKLILESGVQTMYLLYENAGIVGLVGYAAEKFHKRSCGYHGILVK